MARAQGKAAKRRKRLEDDRAAKGFPPPQRRDGRRVAAAARRQAKAAEKTKVVKPAVTKARAKEILARQADGKGEPTAADFQARDILTTTQNGV